MGKSPKGLSLQYQAAIGIGLAVLVVVVATVFAVGEMDKREIRRMLDVRADGAIEQFVSTTENDAIAIGNRGKLGDSASTAVANMPDLAYIRIENRMGRVIAEAGSPLSIHLDPIRRERDYVVAGERFATVFMEWSPQRWLDRARVVSRRSAFIVGGSLLLLGLLTLFLLHRIAIRPIDMIEQRLRARNQDGYIPSLKLRGAPELVRLNEAIDQLNDEHEQRVRLETRLQQSQKMEVVGRLAGGIAHNFNNVLMVVLGYSELLRIQFGGDAKAMRGLNAIDKSVKHASSLTSQLLSLSRQNPQRIEVIDGCSVVRNMQSLLEPTLGASITISMDLSTSPQLISVDLAMLESAILNLAANARDAMPTGGVLLIRCDEATPEQCRRSDIDPAQGGVVLEVADDGIGMEENVQHRLFDPFFTTKAPDKGTGLGLATVFSFVEQSGGLVEVRSALGVGTVFTIVLPRAGQSMGDSEVQIATDRISGINGLDVLLVEDDVSVRSLLTEQLQSLGYNVVAAADASEGEVIFRSGYEIDILLTDVELPDRSGPELASDLRKQDRDLPIVFMTGHIEQSSASVLMSLDRTAFLRKPFSVTSLAMAIDHAISLTGTKVKSKRLVRSNRVMSRPD